MYDLGLFIIFILTPFIIGVLFKEFLSSSSEDKNKKKKKELRRKLFYACRHAR